MRGLKSKVGLLVGAVGLTLLVAEVVARMLVPTSTWPEMYEFSSDPLLGVELRRGSDFDFDGVDLKIPATRVVINALGFRDEAMEVTKPANVHRVMCIGDSMTFGWGVNIEDAWCSRLQTSLGAGVQTVNLGVPGYNARQAVHRFELRGLPMQPDAVVFLFNDSDYGAPLVHGDPASLMATLIDVSALARWIAIRLRRSDSGEGGAAGDPLDSSAEAETSGDDRDSTDPDSDASNGNGDESAVASPVSGVEQVLAAIDRLGQLSLEHGFSAHVVFYGDLGAKQRLVERMDAWGIDYLALGASIADRTGEHVIPGDGHPNAAGHARIADKALESLRRRGAVERGWRFPVLGRLHEPPTWEQLYEPFVGFAPVAASGAGRAVAPAGEGRVQLSARTAVLGAESPAWSAPVRRVEIPAFELAVHETSVAQYARFVVATGHPAPPWRQEWPALLRWTDGRPRAGAESLPITGVDYRDAEAYCRWAGGRLPTEDEWERAARAGDDRSYPWGQRFVAGASHTVYALSGSLSSRAEWEAFRSGYRGPSPMPREVLSPTQDRTPEGVFGLHGNVAEWVAGPAHPPMGGVAHAHPAYYRPNVRPVRGVGFTTRDYSAPVWTRFFLPATERNPALGFRCAWSTAR